MSSNMANEELITQAQEAERAGKAGKAVSLYAKAGEYVKAAQIADKSKMHEDAFDLYLAQGDRDFAAAYAETHGMVREAVDLYMKLGRKDAAEKIAKEAGIYKELFPKKGLFRREYSPASSCIDGAVSRMQKRGNFEAADRIKGNATVASVCSIHLSSSQEQEVQEEETDETLFRKIQRLKSENNLEAAIGAALEEDETHFAIELCIKAGRIDKAHEICTDYCSDNEVFALAYLYRTAGDYSKAADIAFEAEKYTWAMELYRLAGNITRAAELADEGAADHHFAVELYRQAGNHMKAVSIAEEAEDYTLAMEVCLQNNMIEQAVELARMENEFLAISMFRQAGKLQQAAELAEHQEYFLLAMELYNDAGNEQKVKELEEELE